MTVDRYRLRRDALAAFATAIDSVETYVEQHADREERLRLIGLLPALRDAEYQFAHATSRETEN